MVTLHTMEAINWSQETLPRIGLYLAFFAVVYLYVLFNRKLTAKHEICLALDRKIPLIPAFCIPYLSYLPLLYGGVLLGMVILPFIQFQQMIASLVITMGVAYFLYVVMPTRIVRPPVPENSRFSGIIKAIYEWDRPTNLFPSLHVANTVVIALFLLPLAPILFSLWAVSIVLSTLFTKQHYLPDVLGGLILSLSVYAFIA